MSLNLEEPGTFVHFIRHVLIGMPPLSRPQIVFCAVAFDGCNPEEFEDPADVEICAELFGRDVQRVPPKARQVVVLRKGLRCGGTLLGANYCLFAALTKPVNNLGPGEQPAAFLVAPTLSLSAQSYRYVKGSVESNPTLERLLVGKPSETKLGGVVILSRPQDGIEVRIETAAASKGGTQTRGKSVLVALIDEAAQLNGEDSVVSDKEVIRSIQPRLVKGGTLLLTSTVFGETDECYKLVEKHWENPITHLAVKMRTLLVRPDLQDEYERDRAFDEQNAEREYNLVPLGETASDFFNHDSIRACVDNTLPHEADPPENGTRAACGADTGLVSDSSACVILHRAPDGIFRVAEVVELRPKPKQPLVLSEVCRTYAETMKRHKLYHATSDHHELTASQEHLSKHGVSLKAAPGGNAGKVNAFLLLRSLIHSGRLKIPASQTRLIEQLKAVKQKAIPGGKISISSPRRAGHGDCVSALVWATWEMGSNANSMVNTLLAMCAEEPTNQTSGERVRRIGPNPEQVLI